MSMRANVSYAETQTEVRYTPLYAPIIYYRISEGANAIVSVRLSVRLFVSTLFSEVWNRLTVDLERLHVSRS